MAGNYEAELEAGEDDRLEYYTLLNTDQHATQDDIKSAYRRLCRIYHPDRHQDPKKQATAGNFFRKIQEAYNVLIDPRTRAIYDRSGKKGLEDDLALVQRTTLPSELINEYERLRAQWEERTYIQQANPQGNFQMEVDATGLVDGQVYYNQPLLYVKSINVQQSVDAEMTKSTFGSISGMLTASQRAFFGGMQFSLRQLIDNQNWIKVSALAGSQPALSVDSYHSLGTHMYLTTQSVMSLSPYGVVLAANGSLTRRLTDSTMATLSVKQTGNAVSTQVGHKLSLTTEVIGEVQVGYQSSYMKGSIQYKPTEKYSFKSGVKVGTKGATLFCGAEEQVATLTCLGGTVLVGLNEGVVLKLRLIRASMNFQVRIQVSQEVSLASLVYATVIPLGLYACLRVFAIAPFLQRQLLKDLQNKREEILQEALAKKAEAEAAVDLMQETFQRAVESEQAKQGLIIVEAWYGKLFDLQADDQPYQPKIVDVCIPLQCMVQDSKLILQENTKVNIPGFYDPCVGEKKHLRVRYEFRGAPHEVTIDNSEPLIIPRKSHRISVTEE